MGSFMKTSCERLTIFVRNQLKDVHFLKRATLTDGKTLPFIPNLMNPYSKCSCIWWHCACVLYLILFRKMTQIDFIIQKYCYCRNIAKFVKKSKSVVYQIIRRFGVHHTLQDLLRSRTRSVAINPQIEKKCVKLLLSDKRDSVRKIAKIWRLVLESCKLLNRTTTSELTGKRRHWNGPRNSKNSDVESCIQFWISRNTITFWWMTKVIVRLAQQHFRGQNLSMQLIRLARSDQTLHPPTTVLPPEKNTRSSSSNKRRIHQIAQHYVRLNVTGHRKDGRKVQIIDNIQENVVICMPKSKAGNSE